MDETLDRADLRQMQGLAQTVTATRPELLNDSASVGELAWCWARDLEHLGSYWRHRLWLNAGQVIGWGWVCLPHQLKRDDGSILDEPSAYLRWQVDPQHPALLAEILAWYDALTPGIDQGLAVQSADTAAQAIVAAHDYRLDEAAAAEDGFWTQLNRRDLVDILDPTLPDGFRFVTAAEVSAAEAVAAHRSAWDRTRFNAAGFERLRATWPYRADLHVLVEAPDGTLAASAVIWLDEATATAEFEPVGTHRNFRRLGLGRALQLHGMQRARAQGAKQMLVACLGGSAHPAARRLYESVGFRSLSRDLPQIRPAGGRQC